MNAMKLFLLACGAAAIECGAMAQTLTDPGFESYAISPGGFVQPASGAWTFTNNAGVAVPFSANSSTGPLNTWSATRTPFAGQAYASTYANFDDIIQSVTFPSAGTYELSVAAFSPGGTLTMPDVFVDQPLTSGQFRFVFASALTGPTWTTPAGQDWTRYSIQLTVAHAGVYEVGVDNTLTEPYFINYDDFRLQPVPEPGAAAAVAAVAGGLMIAGSWVRRRDRGGRRRDNVHLA